MAKILLKEITRTQYWAVEDYLKTQEGKNDLKWSVTESGDRTIYRSGRGNLILMSQNGMYQASPDLLKALKKLSKI